MRCQTNVGAEEGLSSIVSEVRETESDAQLDGEECRKQKENQMWLLKGGCKWIHHEGRSL